MSKAQVSQTAGAAGAKVMSEADLAYGGLEGRRTTNVKTETGGSRSGESP